MSFFARGSWPADHRDEIVAGALVAAVVVVLGYASGIGAQAPTTIDTAAPPASETSAAPHQPTARSATGPPDTGAGNYGSGSAGGYWPGGNDAGIPVAGGMPSTGGESGHGHGTGGSGGASGGGSSTGPSPSPTPTPTPSDNCDEGEVHLVQPLLNGVVTPVTGLLDGLLSPASPSPSPSPSPSSSAGALSSLCVGVAASPSVVPEVLP
ncbi:hypothetical protein ACIBW9_39395 [Streptomyces sp. NPDC049541]|uniref:hypothetical protein n=1 Tax=Streptomyces sp. NPDC049541 TaxID=3365594 RepID=UPI0037A528CA